MDELSLIMPMAGRGSRFSKEGFELPKPLIELEGKPFFWWATESVSRSCRIADLVFVVLQEHVDRLGIDLQVKELYPDATIVVTPEVTPGAAATAALGIEALTSDHPIAVNDSDHAFALRDPAALLAALRSGTDGALVGFRSDKPAYSYVELEQGTDMKVRRTVEKEVVSPFAIAGCYFFANKVTFEKVYQDYASTCAYNELFMSGLFNGMIERDLNVMYQELTSHVSFGTPEELERVEPGLLASLWQAGLS